MNATRCLLLTTLLACLFVVCPGCGCEEETPDLPPELIGLWESTFREEGRGHAMYLELGADGTAKLSIAMMLDFEYTFDGERVRAVDKTLRVGESFDVETSIADGVMTQGGPSSGGNPALGAIRKTKIQGTGEGDDGIVGVWRLDEGLEPVFERYTADGRILVRIPQAAAPLGRFTSFEVREGEIALLGEDQQPTRSLRYVLEGDTLSLTGTQGEDMTFVRSEFAPWYAIPEEN